MTRYMAECVRGKVKSILRICERRLTAGMISMGRPKSRTCLKRRRLLLRGGNTISNWA